MNCLLIGGCGYLGHPLTQLLLKGRNKVRCLDAMLYGHNAAASLIPEPNYELMVGNLCDEEARAVAFRDMDSVVILAGLVGDPICNRHPGTHHHINVHGIQELIKDLNNYPSIRRAIFLSTCSNYGYTAVAATERHELRPLSSYAKAKVAAEEIMLETAKTYEPVVLRLATAFGLSGRMRFDLTISEFVRTMYAKEKLEVYDSESWRPYCHVHDIACAISMALMTSSDRVSGEIFNVGGFNRAKGDIALEASKRLSGAKYDIVPHRGSDGRNYQVDFTKVRERLHFNATITPEDGIDELIGALKQGFYGDYQNRLPHYRNDQGFNYEFCNPGERGSFKSFGGDDHKHGKPRTMQVGQDGRVGAS